MKNIQIIDGAENCTYDLFSATEEEFYFIFPMDGQDIEFIEDLISRTTEEERNNIFQKIWQRPVEKKEVHGIHGTLFYELEYKKKYYPTKKESEMAVVL